MREGVSHVFAAEVDMQNLAALNCFRQGVSLAPAREEWFRESLGVSHSCRVLCESSLL